MAEALEKVGSNLEQLSRQVFRYKAADGRASRDRELAGIFALQDEITERVVAAVEPQLYAAEGIRAKRKQPESMDAWECVVRALSCVNFRSQNDYEIARGLLERALELDPAYAQAYALFAYVMGLEVLYGWKPREIALARALEAAQKAVVLDSDDAWAHLALGFVYGMTRRAEEAVVEHEKALAPIRTLAAASSEGIT